jgi:hypothetical protein
LKWQDNGVNRFAITIIISLLAVPYCCCSDAREANIAFTGDIIMHIPVKSCAAAHNRTKSDKKTSINNGGFDFLFERIRDDLRESDIAVGNMEFPVSPPFQSRPWIFNCFPEVINSMKWAGFTMLSVANNHILDQGGQGVVDTMGFLAKYNIDCIGAGDTEEHARAGVVRSVRGIRIGFLSYTGVLNYPLPVRRPGYYLNRLGDREGLKRDIEEIKKRCDYLVMVVHDGAEYMARPRPLEQGLYRECVNNGVDLVIGHHPHMVQQAEKFMAADGRTCHIFYSLGNFVSNQSTKAEVYYGGAPLTTRDSVIVRCFLKRAGSGKRPSARFEILPVYTINDIEGGTGPRAIQTVSIIREISGLKSKLAGAPAKEKVDIERQLKNLYQKLKALRMALYGAGDAGNLGEIKLLDNSGTYE